MLGSVADYHNEEFIIELCSTMLHVSAAIEVICQLMIEKGWVTVEELNKMKEERMQVEPFKSEMERVDIYRKQIQEAKKPSEDLASLFAKLMGADFGGKDSSNE